MLPSMSVDEKIWGHRLYDEQTPWLCILEFLTICEAQADRNQLLIEGDNLSYMPHNRIYLRNILFNNPYLLQIQRESSDDNLRWNLWLEKMNKWSVGSSNFDYSYLRSRFASFDDFVTTVEFIRSSAIEGNSNKRWSSKFVFPYGPDCLYEDLRVTGTSFQNDRRFFARTGELLYLMVCRSGKTDELNPIIKSSLLCKSNKWNKLIKALQPHTINRSANREGSYLPYQSLPEYASLAEDWLRLFSCQMPHYDFLPYMVIITGLHFLIYFLNRSHETLCDNERANFIIEITSPKKTLIRDISSTNYNSNNELSRLAIEKYIRNVEEKEEWIQCKKHPDALSKAQDILCRYYDWEDDSNVTTNPNDLLKAFLEKAITRHKQHVYKFHHTWGKQIGLSSAKGSKRLRYAPNDGFIKTLVLCTVDGRMEYNEFLSVIYKKYGLIIGDQQAGVLIKKGLADQETFSDNAARLEQRLSSMGLLTRLSDACAYVINPFSEVNPK